MMYRAVVVALVVACVVPACQHEDDGGVIRCTKSQTSPCAMPVDAPMAIPVCRVCTTDDECGDGGICKQYGDGYGKCSPACSPGQAASQCGAPSTGSCNGMGYCMCPRIDDPPPPPGDGGQPLDAPEVFVDAN